MQPAFSLIVFTVMAGTGYGMLFVLAGAALFGALRGTLILPGAGLILAFVLITIGLASSTLHLGHPERAWRAFSEWRSSWLSREAVAAAASYPIGGLFTLAWLLGGGPASPGLLRAGWMLLALATAAIAIATVVCTGMIYATLKPVARWRNRWVVPNFLAFALECGALWLAALDALLGEAQPALVWIAVASVVLALVLKFLYWSGIEGTAVKSSMESATGLGHLGKVRLIAAPFSATNFVMNEMGYRIAPEQIARLRLATAVAAFALPLILSLSVVMLPRPFAQTAMVIAAIAATVGALSERWLFFAEAKHTAGLYYGRRLS